MKQVLWVLVAAAVASPVTAQVPAGGQFQVNTYTTGTQWFPGLVVGPNGDFVVSWGSIGQDGSGGGIFARRYDRAGAPLGGEFQVNTYSTGLQNYYGSPAVALDGRGNFVVAWGSEGQDGSGWGVFGQRFNAAGTRLGVEFQVNTYTTGDQGGVLAFNDIGVDMTPSGSLVIVWASEQEGQHSGLGGPRFNAAGTRVGSEFQVNTQTLGYQGAPDVSNNASGRFVLVWSTADWGDDGVAARRYDAAGAAIGAEFLVNTYTTGNQSYFFVQPPSVAMNDLGAFVVAWDGDSQDGSNYGVFARRFDANGNALGTESRVNTYTTGNQVLSTLAADPVGNFVVSWQSAGQDGSSYGVFAQRFTATGAPRGAEFRVNTYITSFQGVADVGVDGAGNFVVGWHGNPDPGNGIYAQRFGGLFPAALAVDTGGNRVLEPGETVDVRPSWLNRNGAVLTFSGSLVTPSGPPGGVPAILDGTGNYGTVANGITAPCVDCYSVSVPAPSSRPATHWDAFAVEAIAPDNQGQAKLWSLHVGNSFTDVPAASGFYPFIEAIFHRGITGGCAPDAYCPSNPTTRAQMSVFILVAKEGTGYAPPPCTAPPFSDVPPSDPFCPWIAELSRRGVVSGCGGGNYCPALPVSRDQMSVFVLRVVDPALNPPPCVPPNLFADVPETSGFCRFIEELANRGVVSGCGGGNYCPTNPVTREQMSVFISSTFGFTLYGP